MFYGVFTTYNTSTPFYSPFNVSGAFFDLLPLLAPPPQLIFYKLSQVWQGKSQATGAEIAGSLCCAQGLFTRARHGFLNRDGLERRVDVVLVLHA